MTKANTKTIYATNALDDIAGILDSSESKKGLIETVRTHIMDTVEDCVMDTLESGALTSPEALWEYLKSQKQDTYTVYKVSLEPVGSNFDFAHSRSFVREAWKAYKEIYAVEKEAREEENKYEQEEHLRQYRSLYKEFGGLSPDEVKGNK